MITYAEYMQANPESYIPEGRALDHDMEYDEHTGFERCNECGGWENEIDDVCPNSRGAVDEYTEWEDYEAVGERGR